MRFPHSQYIDYLMSKRESSIQEHLEDLALPYPSDEGLQSLATKLGPIPKSWSKTLLKTNLAFRRWLQKRDLLELWQNPVLLHSATQLLEYPQVRSELEVGILRDVPYSEIAEAVDALAGIVLTPEMFSMYRKVFWDTEHMDTRDWKLYLRYRPDRDVEEALQRRQEIRARGLDRRDDIADVEYLGDILRITRSKMVELSRQSATASSAQAMAMLAKVAMEALTSRQDLVNPADGDDFDYVEHWRSRFVLDTVESETNFLTYDDVKDDEDGQNTALVGVLDGAQHSG